MESINFGYPAFHPGLNLTVRRGLEWAGRAKPGHSIALQREGTDEVVGTATVVSSDMAPPGPIPEALLVHEHDPECRTWAGLMEVLDRAYGAPGDPIDWESEDLTLVWLWVR